MKPFSPLILTFILRPINIPGEERFVVNLWTASQKSISGINKLMRYPNNLTRICYFVQFLLYLFYYIILIWALSIY